METRLGMGFRNQYTLQIVNGGVKYGAMAIATVEIAGFANATPAQNLPSSTHWPGLPFDQYSNPYDQLMSADTLQATFATSLTSSDLISIVASRSDF